MGKELDDLMDGPKHGPARSSRFAPKGSKLVTGPKPRTGTSSSLASVPLPAPKKEEVGDKAKMEPKHENIIVDMDVELNPEVEKMEVIDDPITEAGEGDVGSGDEVVQEMEVYFSPCIDPETQLYLFQYPLRPSWRPYELDDRCEKVRLKPTSSEVEIDLAIDVDPKNYDTSADSKIQITKQTLATRWKPPQTRGCTLCVLSGNKLHLNLIHAVVQLRPSPHHLDQISKSQKTLEQTKDIEEAWIPLKYHSTISDTASRYFQRTLAGEGSQIHFSMSSHDYLDGLCPGSSGDNLSAKLPPRSLLLALPLKERFTKWLLEGPPLQRFDTLKYLAAPDESIEEVLGVLQELAFLIQGLWIPRTSLLYGKDQTLEHLARNYVLVLFNKDVIIKCDQIPKSPKLAQEMKNVLHGLARERHVLKDWKLKELPDSNFIKLYPAVVKKYQDELEREENAIKARSIGGKSRPGMKTSKSSTPASLVASSDSDKLAARTSSGSMPRKEMAEEACDAIRKAIQKLFRSIKTCRFQQISQRLRDMAVSEHARASGSSKEVSLTAANSIDAFPDEFHTILSQVAVNIHGICVPKSSPDHPEYDDLRQVVIDLLLAEPQAKLKKAHILDAATKKLGKEPTQAAYQKVMQELCVSQQGSWTLRIAD